MYLRVGGDLLRRTIELKQRLTDLTSRENKITYYEDDGEWSSDSDMEEVPPSYGADDLLARCLTKSDDNVILSTTCRWADNVRLIF